MSDILRAIEAAVLEKQAENSWDTRDVDIEHEGTKITLPKDPVPMTTTKAIEALERKKKDEETDLDVLEVIEDYHPLDALVSFNEAMRQIYGWSSPTPKMTFFGPIPPNLVTVKTGHRDQDSVQAPMGNFTLPGIENQIETGVSTFHGARRLYISGTVKKREATILRELATKTRQLLRENSIYKGKAVRLRVDDDGDIDWQTPPEFFNTAEIDESELILNDDEHLQVEAALWAPILKTKECRKHGIPLNRGCLLEGTYGTGKTMTATVTSKICEQNGWTYIALDDVSALAEALLFAKNYEPAVIFAEDIDRALEDRDDVGNTILNTIDGILTKKSEVITVLTTNHVDKLDKAMMRPGRLDAVISVKPPRGTAVERLIRLYGRDTISPKTKLDKVADVLAGNIPATIREVVERSKLAMVYNGNKSITEDDLIITAQTMQTHLAILNEAKDEVSDEHKLGEAMKTIVTKAVVGGEEFDNLTDEIHRASFAIRVKADDLENSNNKLRKSIDTNTEKAGDKLETIGDKVDEIHDEVC